MAILPLVTAWARESTGVMVLLVILLTASVLCLAGWRVLVPRDGYGINPAPRGRNDWSAGDLPSRPYGSG